jgi:hypothetical protein
MVSKNGMRTRERICYLIGRYQCLQDDECISAREKKIYTDILEDLRYLLETAMQEGLQS